jgi:hypothetical protein
MARLAAAVWQAQTPGGPHCLKEDPSEGLPTREMRPAHDGLLLLLKKGPLPSAALDRLSGLQHTFAGELR